MLYCGKPGIEFSAGKFTCILNNKFNLLLFTENCAVFENKNSELIGFVVPTDYLSFIKTLNISNDLYTDLKNIFVFKKQSDLNELKKYVSKLPKNQKYTILKELKIKN